MVSLNFGRYLIRLQDDIETADAAVDVLLISDELAFKHVSFWIYSFERE